MKVLLIIPAYNEAENIERVIDELKSICPEYDYLIINDCSTDSTGDICQKNRYSFVSNCCNLGIGGGVQCGYLYALRNGYDYAIQLDGDGQHDATYIPEMISFLEKENADVVIGSRFIQHEGFQSSGMRRFGIVFLSKLIKIVCHADVRDVTSGFRLVNRKMIRYYANEYADDYPEPEAIVAAQLHGAVIKEYPVKMRSRSHGTSSISPLKSIYYMLKVSLAIILFRITHNKEKIT